MRFKPRHSSAKTPTNTFTPAARKISTPRPLTFGLGSKTPTTTVPTPFSKIKFAQGGVFPKCAQGSNDTYKIQSEKSSFCPPASNPSNNIRSACAPPKTECHPSATTNPSLTKTAPTIGFGLTFPQPRSAKAKHRRIQNSCSKTDKLPSLITNHPTINDQTTSSPPTHTSSRNHTPSRRPQPAQSHSPCAPPPSPAKESTQYTDPSTPENN